MLTQTQLASINPETPAGTLRYRCARLTREGLAGRSRPYRERGSAPHHFWPTRKGEAIVTGGPPPRGGERREPNRLFLAHAAGLSEVYVALKTTLPAEVKLTRFEREADAREPFTAWASREKRAIAPDAFIEITEADGGALLAFVELDMGSMSHRRLKTKATGYAEYVKVEAWRERHPFCPALLFLTTVEKRARSFLAAMEKEAGRDSLLLTCACDLARRLPDCASEDRWLLSVNGGRQAVDLLTALREARRPFDEEQERAKAERDRKETPSASTCARTPRRFAPTCDLGLARTGESSGSKACEGDRLPADELEEAILAQLLAVLEREPMVREAISEAFAELDAEQPQRAAELERINAELRNTGESLDRYFRAFEESTMPESACGPRIKELSERLRGLQARQEELAAEEPAERDPLSDEDLALLQAEVREVIESGDPPTRKALLQSLVDEIRVVSRAEIYPSFSLPAVRPPSGSVPPVGFEPTTIGLEGRCSVH